MSKIHDTKFSLKALIGSSDSRKGFLRSLKPGIIGRAKRDEWLQSCKNYYYESCSYRAGTGYVIVHFCLLKKFQLVFGSVPQPVFCWPLHENFFIFSRVPIWLTTSLDHFWWLKLQSSPRFFKGSAKNFRTRASPFLLVPFNYNYLLKIF